MTFFPTYRMLPGLISNSQTAQTADGVLMDWLCSKQGVDRGLDLLGAHLQSMLGSLQSPAHQGQGALHLHTMPLLDGQVLA